MADCCCESCWNLIANRYTSFPLNLTSTKHGQNTIARIFKTIQANLLRHNIRFEKLFSLCRKNKDLYKRAQRQNSRPGRYLTNTSKRLFSILGWCLISWKSKMFFWRKNLKNGDWTEHKISIGRKRTAQCDQIWRNFAILAKSSKSWAIFEGLCTIWENLGPNWANFVCHWASFHWCKWQMLKNNLAMW